MLTARDKALLQERFPEGNPLLAVVVTLSDRASAGAYEDVSGDHLAERLRVWAADAHLAVTVERHILPDDETALRGILETAVARGAQGVFTTGGTGVGPRDITPEVVLSMATREIPGVMEHIRMKYGDHMPLALLSRSVAAMIGPCVIYTLPGSPKAVDEYMTEILKTFGHIVCVAQGLDAH